MPQLFTNNARALLASGITDTATSITIEASKADLFPTANTGTGSIPSVNNWFKATLQDALGNVEIVYVRTRNAGSGVFSNVLRGQEGTTARAYSAGDVVGLRITAADVEGSIAAANNSVQLTGNQTIDGVKTFNQTVSGSITGNAGTVTNGVYTTGDQTIGGAKTFSGTLTVSGSRIYQTSSAIGFEMGPGAGTGNTNIQGYYVPAGKTLHFQAGSGTMALDGSGNFTASGNVTAYSDIRLKTDLTKISDALRKISQLTGYTYTRRDTGERQTGVVAQEVQAVLPEAVIEQGDGTLAVAYGNMVGLLIEAVKELTARVEKLEGR
jgi:hypothetical protein